MDGMYIMSVQNGAALKYVHTIDLTDQIKEQ
jgi:hypothetical protein